MPGAFVGREAERVEIRAALERAAAGQGGLILLVGGPGIGKTRLADAGSGDGRIRLVGDAGIGKPRLADEASDDARALGFDVVWGRCWEGEAAPAFLPWTQVMRALPRPAAGPASALA